MLGLSSSQRKLLHCVKLMRDSSLPFLLVSPNTLQRRCTTERGAWKGGGGGRGEGRRGERGDGGGGRLAGCEIAFLKTSQASEVSMSRCLRVCLGIRTTEDAFWLTCLQTCIILVCLLEIKHEEIEGVRVRGGGGGACVRACVCVFSTTIRVSTTSSTETYIIYALVVVMDN